jgi:hypothetical protein
MKPFNLILADLNSGQSNATLSAHFDELLQAVKKHGRAFKVGVRIFQNGGGYLLNARLKYRLGQGAVKFFYELDRPERAVELAFEGYVAEVREKSGFTVLLGAAG